MKYLYQGQRWLVFGLIGALMALSSFSPTRAATLPFSGTLGTTSYTRVNENCVTPATGTHFYDAYVFHVDTSGSYTLETLTANLAPSGSFDDTYLFLYSPAFNPGAPPSNCLAGNDDRAPGEFLSRITANLTAGTTYVLVVTSFDAGAMGPYTGQISGPGNITLGAALFGGDVFDPGDDRINRAGKDRAAPVAIYCRDEGITVLRIDPVTAQGTTAVIEVSRAIIDMIGIPQGGHVPLAGKNGYSLWRLEDGRFQVNAFYANEPNKPYIFVWTGCDPSTAEHLAN